MELREGYETSQIGEKEKSRKYNIDGIEINVNYRVFNPNKAESERQSTSETENEVVVFLPGWSMGAATKSAARIGQAYANASNLEAFTIDTRPEKITEDSLFKESRAIERFLTEKGVKKATIVGHSEGGIKATDLAVLLQHDNLTRGIILLDSMGMQEQTPTRLAAGFAKDAIINTQQTMWRDLLHGNAQTFASGLQASTDIIFGIANEILHTKNKYPQRLSKQIREMTETQTHFAELQVPLVIATGAKDPISNPDRTMPGYKEINKLEHDEATGTTCDPREIYIKENLFPNAPFVRMAVGEKLGHHGMPLFRAQTVAKTTFYLLERSYRNQVR